MRDVENKPVTELERDREMQDRMALLEGIARGERAILEGRVVSHAAAKQRLRRWLPRSG